MRYIKRAAGERPPPPKTGTPDHLLLSILSLGYRIEIITTSVDGPNTFTGALRRLRRAGHQIREFSGQDTYGRTHKKVLALDTSPDDDLVNDEGAITLMTVFDSVASVRGRR
jgi:Flp pilus assembly CpaE family ATPase